jgi:hypothetical protein
LRRRFFCAPTRCLGTAKRSIAGFSLPNRQASECRNDCAFSLASVSANDATCCKKTLTENVKNAASLGFLGQGPFGPVSSLSAAGRAKASLFASLTFLDRASLRGLRSPSTAMAHRGRYWPRDHEGKKPHHTNGGKYGE